MPWHAIAASAPGYRQRPGDLVGQSGLEQAFETVLRGQPGLRQVEVGAVGRETQVIASTPATPGMDLVLTIDRQLQQLAERLLAGHRGSIVALDPRHGQILALASQPAFDPNAFVPRPSPATWRALSTNPHFPLHNRATQGQYPPGSVFKIVTALVATGVVSALAGQIFLNIAMTIGIVPILGLPLPLLSYGGSSLVMTFLCLGLLMNVRMRRFKSGMLPP